MAQNDVVNNKRNDRLFKLIFGSEEHKDWTLSLFNAINGTAYTDASQVELTTIEDVVYMKMKNDVSFFINQTMSFYEQQSTFNPNMPLRMLAYSMKVYSAYLEKEDKANRLYGTRNVGYPTPKLVVFFNGTRNLPGRTILKFSDGCLGELKSDIEAEVLMLNINRGMNRELMEKCKPLSEYSLFTTNVRQFIKDGVGRKESVDKALDLLPDDSELKRLILINKAEVIELFLTEYNEDAVHEVFREEGYDEGRNNTLHEVTVNMLKNGVDIKIIAACTSLSLEEIQELKKTI